ncbi:MAG TPA: DNA adenine methylase [Candidatus Thermoplasmatota archaeon]|nr:DNA adenine methylase [Candidatus Thermoplasmatota archaeon]
MRSPIKWFGGKSLLAETIVRRIPKHECYVEVFGGAAWVLFRKERSKSEIYNDIHADLVNFFRVLRNQQDEFLRKAKFLMPSRDDFLRARDEPREPLDPVERALRFYLLVSQSFNCNLREYRPTKTRPPSRVDMDRLREASQRLQRVWIERLDFEELIRRYDSPQTFFFLDPPYAPIKFTSGVYGWSDPEHDRLKRVVAGIKGRFLMTYPDWPRLRELWSEYPTERIPTQYRSFNREAQPRYADVLLISNYDTAKVCPLVRPGFAETVVNLDDLQTEP